jgi:hypothetical protein
MVETRKDKRRRVERKPDGAQALLRALLFAHFQPAIDEIRVRSRLPHPEDSHRNEEHGTPDPSLPPAE